MRMRGSPSGPPLTVENSLAGVYFVDANTRTPRFQQNGSVSAPFSTLTAAVEAANARSQQAITFNIESSFAYAAEAPLQIPGGRIYIFQSSLRSCAFPGVVWTPTGSFTVDPLTASVLFLRNLQVTGPIDILTGAVPATDARAGAENCGFSGPITQSGSSFVTWNFSGISNAELIATTSTSVSSIVSAPVDLRNADVFVSDTQFAAGCTSIRAGRLFAKSSTFEQDIFAHNAVIEAQGCLWKAIGRSVTFVGAAGVMTVDALTYSSFLLDDTTLVNGNFFSALALLGDFGQSLAWDTVTPATQTHVVLPAVHPPGYYQINRSCFRRVTASAGTITPTTNWTDPNVGPTSTAQTVSLVGTGLVAIAANTNLIYTNGNGAVSVVWTVAGVTGSPVIDIYSSATRVG